MLVTYTSKTVQHKQAAKKINAHEKAEHTKKCKNHKTTLSELKI